MHYVFRFYREYTSYIILQRSHEINNIIRRVYCHTTTIYNKLTRNKIKARFNLIRQRNLCYTLRSCADFSGSRWSAVALCTQKKKALACEGYRGFVYTSGRGFYEPREHCPALWQSSKTYFNIRSTLFLLLLPLLLQCRFQYSFRPAFNCSLSLSLSLRGGFFETRARREFEGGQSRIYIVALRIRTKAPADYTRSDLCRVCLSLSMAFFSGRTLFRAVRLFRAELFYIEISLSLADIIDADGRQLSSIPHQPAIGVCSGYITRRFRSYCSDAAAAAAATEDRKRLFLQPVLYTSSKLNWILQATRQRPGDKQEGKKEKKNS